MFTGIVEEIGTVKSVQSKVITIEASKIFDDLLMICIWVIALLLMVLV